MQSKKVEEDYKALVASNTWTAVYQSITQRCHSYRYTCVEAKKAENKPLNRYRDVNPYDHSRIVLRREGFDYINANLVKVERANRQYILTQGPLVYTSGHFWLMIWEQKCPAIIMLNRVIENLEVKCHWYWPHEKGQTAQKPIPYADVNMTVSQVSELNCNYYTIRKLRVTNHETEESRDIWQFHYTTWPDFGVPESPHAFLVFLKHVNDYNALDGTEGPAVVHCSAGIGRSGTFCLVDSVLVLVQNEGQTNVDVQEVLLEMRRYRMGLIQTSEQFRFSYKAIVEGIKRMDPDYELNSDVVPEPEQRVVRQEEEAPPPPPPRGESLGQPPARPLPAIPASASMDNGTPFHEHRLYMLRRALAFSIAASGKTYTEHQTERLFNMLQESATADIETTAVRPYTPTSLTLLATRIVLAGNQEPNAMETHESMSMIDHTYENIPCLPRILISTVPSIQNSTDSIYISSEDLTTYNTPDNTSDDVGSSEFMDTDPPANVPHQDHNIIELSSSVDSDGSDAPPTPPPRPRLATPETPPTGSSYEEIDEDNEDYDNSEGLDTDAEMEIVGGSEKSGLRRRRKAALADRVADMKRRSREADHWNSMKRSFLKPLAISVGVGLLAVAGVLIYSYTHRH